MCRCDVCERGFQSPHPCRPPARLDRIGLVSALPALVHIYGGPPVQLGVYVLRSVYYLNTCKHVKARIVSVYTWRDTQLVVARLHMLEPRPGTTRALLVTMTTQRKPIIRVKRISVKQLNVLLAAGYLVVIV